MSAQLPVSLRIKMATDFPRIASDWLKSYRNAPGMKPIPNEVFYWWTHRIVESFWADPTCAVLVACAPDDPNKIFGWFCGQRADSLAGDQTIAHYCYVAKLYRRMGLASRLLEAFDSRPDAASQPLVITHRTDAGRELLAKRTGPVIYNPYLAWSRAPALGSHPPKQVLKKKDPVIASRRDLAFSGFPREAGEEESE